jgi:hypothetical protein
MALLDSCSDPLRLHFALADFSANREFERLLKKRFGKEQPTMLWTIAVLLLILWMLGMVSSYTLGGFIHILLVLAVVAILIRLIQGRSPVV